MTGQCAPDADSIQPTKTIAIGPHQNLTDYDCLFSEFFAKTVRSCFFPMEVTLGWQLAADWQSTAYFSDFKYSNTASASGAVNL